MKDVKFKDNNLLIFAGIVIVVLAIGFSGYEAQSRSVVVQGEATKSFEPELFKINIGAEYESLNVNEAEEFVQRRVNDLKSNLLRIGISEDEIVKDTYNIMPVYTWRNSEQVLRGYKVSQIITIRSEKLDLISEVINSASESNANVINSLIFDLTEETKAKNKNYLVEKAVLNAMSQAESVAKASNTNLGKPLQVNVTRNNYYPVFERSMVAMDSMAGFESDANINIGSLEQSVSVTAKFSLR